MGRPAAILPMSFLPALHGNVRVVRYA